jgi:hypothetical protein
MTCRKHPRRRRRRVLVALVVTLASCVTQERRGTPLYPRAEPPRRRDEVALLYGPIATVDDEKVAASGNTFELLPGCHIVTIGGKTGKVDPLHHGGWVATLPPLTYAFRMRAGGSYSIDFEIDPSLGVGPTGTGRVVAREHDAQGRAGVVPPVQNSAEIDACREWMGGAHAPGGS